MREKVSPLLLAFYGDDFTGSSDALDFLGKAGVKTVLFIAPPTSVQLAKYEGVQAIGVAGMTRSMVPEAMEHELRNAFGALKQSGARQVHYKVCSTFDSSPKIGNIGKALEVGLEAFQVPYASLLVAAPELGRYCAFGNLFARMGIGSQGKIHRLDRHPSMSKHPTTPADESDLRLHLAKQTDLKVGLVDVLAVETGGEVLAGALQHELEAGAKAVLFDAMYSRQLSAIGGLMDRAAKERPHFSVGSSGIEMALGAYWKAEGLLPKEITWDKPGKAGPMLVLSGSCSPITEGQITHARVHGFGEVAIDPEQLVSGPKAVQQYVQEVLEIMEKGKSLIVHTACGTEDSRRAVTRKILINQGVAPEDVSAKTADFFGQALGEIARKVAEKYPYKRLLIAGGDTSSKVARVLGIEAVEMIAPLVPGAPLCVAHAPASPIDGMEVNFKGGQVGAEDYFVKVMEGNVGG